MSSIVETLEARLLEPFEALANRLSDEFPNVIARAYSYAVGSSTEYEGHSMGVDCILTNASPDSADNVALTVDLAWLTTSPRISAGVVWGHPSGHSESSFGVGNSLSDWDEISDEVLENLFEALPRLYESLIEAVRRRKPSDE